MEAIVKHPGQESVVPCPCGESHRFFTASDRGELGLHVTRISGVQPHWHSKMTEVYYVVEAAPDAQVELNGQVCPVRVGTAILIPPGVIHRGIGDFRVVVVYNHPELHEKDTFHS